jgi:hypothetical protein
MKLKLTSCVILVLLALWAVPSAAPAADGPYFGGYGLFGWGCYPFYGGAVSVPGPLPYYALYPPVYYSRPVPRTYGFSPFAYPLGSPTPEEPERAVAREVVRPVRIVNPYVAQSSASELPKPPVPKAKAE